MNRKETYNYKVELTPINERAKEVGLNGFPNEIRIDGSYDSPSFMFKEAFSSTDKYGTNAWGTTKLSDVDKIYFGSRGHILLVEEKTNSKNFKGASIDFKIDTILKNGKTSILLVETDYTTEVIKAVELILFNGFHFKIQFEDFKDFIKALLNLFNNDSWLSNLEEGASKNMYGAKDIRLLISDGDILVYKAREDDFKNKYYVELATRSRSKRLGELSPCDISLEELDALQSLIEAYRLMKEGNK